MSEHRICLIHGIPDCSPLLNGCPVVTDPALVPEGVKIRHSPPREPIAPSENIRRLNIAIGESELRAVERFAIKHGKSRAAAARQLIARGLEAPA